MFGSRLAYSVCMILATLVAGSLLRRSQSGLRLSGLQKLGIGLGGLIGATFAAKVPFVLAAGPDAGLLGAWLSDGKTVLWALVGGYLGVEVAKWSLDVRESTGDTFVIPLALAIAIGRIGCFLYGCCFGIPTDGAWGIRYLAAPDAGEVLRHPTQLYELLFHLTAALVVWGFANESKTSAWRGNWMPTYLVSYAAFRYFSEYYRPEARLAGGLTFYQWSALVIALGFSVLLVRRMTRVVNPSRSA